MADGTPTKRPTSTGVFINGGMQVGQSNRTEALAVSTASAQCATAAVDAAALVSILCGAQCYVLQGTNPTAVRPSVGTPGSTPIPPNTQVLLGKREGYKLAIIADTVSTAYIEVIS